MSSVVEDQPAGAQQQQQQQQTKARKPTRNELRRAKKRAQKHEGPKSDPEELPDAPEESKSKTVTEPEPTNIPEPVVEDVTPEDPLYAQFQNVFAKYQQRGSDGKDVAKALEKQVFFGDEDNVQDESEEEETKAKLSKKARKARDKLSVAELKAMVAKPELVDWTDTSSIDPKLLIHIKSTRNVVPVPSHWQLKREWLSSKRGVERQNFRLPQFIAETGIAEMRDNSLAGQGETLKQQQRARVNPKMNRLDVDYGKLFEAFFRRQTKPHLTRFGEVYYEGKEFESDLQHLRPGDISDTLREALNMPPGAPPPWLINQQKTGCPPSYPAMKIPGVNAPLPPGAKWGFEPGQYGKPPVKDDISMIPLWGGDLFGSEARKREEEKKARPPEPPISRALWGELQSLEEEDEEDAQDDDEEEEDEDEEEEEEETAGNGVPTPFTTKEVDAEINISKPGYTRAKEPESSSHPRSAGEVISERAVEGQGFFASDRAYNLTNKLYPVLGSESEDRGKKRKAGDLDVSMDVDALERGDGLSKNEIKKQYDETRQRERVGQWQGKVDQDDLSNMIAEENAKRLKRDQDQRRRR